MADLTEVVSGIEALTADEIAERLRQIVIEETILRQLQKIKGAGERRRRGKTGAADSEE